MYSEFPYVKLLSDRFSEKILLLKTFFVNEIKFRKTLLNLLNLLVKNMYLC